MSLGGAPQCSSLPREQSESCSIWKGFSLFVCLFISIVCAPESVECFLRDVVFADGVLEADVEAVLLVYHMEARVLIIIECKR